MKLRRVAAAFCLLTAVALAIANTSAQDSRGPSTVEERKQAVQIARLLESDPFHEKAKDARRWFTIWLIQVPDISVSLCSDYLSPLYKSDKNYSSEITNQMMFSSVAFMIEHPDQDKDLVAINLAGLEGSLKTYEAILKAKPKAKSAFLDDLILKRDKGELIEYVRQIGQTKCKR